MLLRKQLGDSKCRTTLAVLDMVSRKLARVGYTALADEPVIFMLVYKPVISKSLSIEDQAGTQYD